MLKVMVVEDDINFMYAIKKIINWKNYGFTICAEAVNGKQALEVLEELVPDLIVTDISMPMMNGVELIKNVKAHFPLIKIIVLSSYEDFEFVKDSLKYGAEDYILKHDFDSKNMIDVLNRVKNRILAERESLKKEYFIKTNMYFIMQEFVRNIVGGRLMSMAEISENMKMLNLPVVLSKFVIAIVEIDNSNEIEKRIDYETAIVGALVTAANESIISSGTGVYARIDNNSFVILIDCSHHKSEASVNYLVLQALQCLKDKMQKSSKQTITIGVSKICNSINDVQKFYKQSKLALGSKLYNGGNRIYFYVDKEHNTNIRIVDNKLIEKISSAVDSGDQNFIIETLNKLFEDIVEKKPNEFYLEKIYLKLTAIFHHSLSKSGTDLKDSEIEEINTLHLLNSMDYIHQHKDVFVSAFLKLLTSSRNVSPKYSREVFKAVDFIRKNYSQSITLAMVAEEVGLCPNYLCNIFRNETGQRLMEYINGVRIEEAKKLIDQTNQKVYEIAEKVGFRNATYFSTTFKEITGLKILEYKNRI